MIRAQLSDNGSRAATRAAARLLAFLEPALRSRLVDPPGERCGPYTILDAAKLRWCPCPSTTAAISLPDGYMSGTIPWGPRHDQCLTVCHYRDGCCDVKLVGPEGVRTYVADKMGEWRRNTAPGDYASTNPDEILESFIQWLPEGVSPRAPGLPTLWDALFAVADDNNAYRVDAPVRHLWLLPR